MPVRFLLRTAEHLPEDADRYLHAAERACRFVLDTQVGPDDQGVDDGLIRKGDTWGGLGRIYSAGTSGLASWSKAGSGPETG